MRDELIVGVRNGASTAGVEFDLDKLLELFRSLERDRTLATETLILADGAAVEHWRVAENYWVRKDVYTHEQALALRARHLAARPWAAEDVERHRREG